MISNLTPIIKTTLYELTLHAVKVSVEGESGQKYSQWSVSPCNSRHAFTRTTWSIPQTTLNNTHTLTHGQNTCLLMSLWSKISPSTPSSLSSFSFCLNCCLGVLHRARRRLPHPARRECGRGCCSHTVRAPGRAGYCASRAPLSSRTHTPHQHTLFEWTHRNKAHLSLLQDTIFFTLLRRPWPNLHLTTPSAEPDFYSTFWHAERCKETPQTVCFNCITGDWHLGSISYSCWQLLQRFNKTHTQNLPLAVSYLAED